MSKLDTGFRLLLCILLASCTSGGAPDHREGRDQLVAELTKTAAQADLALPIDTARVEWGADHSSVIPGLVYHTAIYRPTDASHGYLFALVGARDGNYVTLGDTASWMALATGWTAASAEESIRACREFVRATSGGAGLYRTPLLPRQDTSAFDYFLPLDRRVVEERVFSTPDSVEFRSNSSRRMVSLWMVIASPDREPPAAAVRYRCEIPATNSPDKRFRAEVVDSVRLVHL